MIDDLKIIKKKYGEKMMHLCRVKFPLLLDTPGMLSKALLSNFEPSRFLYDDLLEYNMVSDFEEYIYDYLNIDNNEVVKTDLTPKELLDIAGYDLYECKTEADIQSFKKYYIPREELCTFFSSRLLTCFVFFAVKKNVSEIKREDFLIPKRDDLYGTSVISIQFARGRVNSLSIKNRYNHMVVNPDATFSNNLDNIIPGLSYSFEKTYGLNFINSNFGELDIPGYVKADDGKYYKYNYEINNIYYCPNNIIIDNYCVVNKYRDCGKYIILDYFVLDLEHKKISLYDSLEKDSFVDGLDVIDKINIIKFKDTGSRRIEIYNNDRVYAVIEIDNVNRIIKYYNDNVSVIGNDFLNWNLTLEKLKLLKVMEIGDNFLYSNNILKKIDFGNILKVGDGFLYNNELIVELLMPKLMMIGKYFLCNNNNLLKLNLANVEVIGDRFLHYNEDLKVLNLPKVKYVGNDFLGNNKNLKFLDVQNLVEVGNWFLKSNKELEKVELPMVEKIGDGFLYHNYKVNSIWMPKVKFIGNYFLYNNMDLEKLVLFNTKCLGNWFLKNNTDLKEVELPMVEKIGMGFLYANKELEKLELPSIIDIDSHFLRSNKKLNYLAVPKLESADKYFLYYNENLKNYDFSNLCDVVDDVFLPGVKRDKRISILKKIRLNKETFFNKYLGKIFKNGNFMLYHRLRRK